MGFRKSCSFYKPIPEVLTVRIFSLKKKNWSQSNLKGGKRVTDVKLLTSFSGGAGGWGRGRELLNLF